MDRAAAEAAFAPAALEALKDFPVAPGEVRLVSLSENATFRVVDRSDGAAYVLRLHRPGYHTLAELESERVWIRALADAGIAVPTLINARDGRDYVTVSIAATGERRHAGLTRWIDGRILADVLRHNADVGTLERHFEQLGAIAATLHNQASEWRAPVRFERHAFDLDGLMGEAPFWGRFWEHPALSRDERALLLDARERVRGALERYGQEPSTYSMIHADLHPANLVIDGERLTVIDFDDAGFGWHLYDVAVAFFHYRTRSDLGIVERAFRRGYRAVRELPDDALELLPMFTLIRGMATIGWIGARPELDRPEYLRGLKEWVCATCRTFDPPC